jgi:DNA repair protein RadC
MQYNNMTNRALLELLLGADAVVAQYHGRLSPLFEAESDHAHEALTPLLAARELLRRWCAEELVRTEQLTSRDAIKRYLVLLFAGQRYESFVTVFLDVQHRVLEVEESFRGTLTRAAVYPREIVTRALYWNAAAVVFAHNHPGGIAEPSEADRQITESLGAALALVDVQVLDHLVVAGSAVTSLVERGMG